MKHLGIVDKNTFAGVADELITAARANASAAAPTAGPAAVGQAGLSIAMQACVNASCDGVVTTTDIVGAFASAYAGWVIRHATTDDEIEDALIALARGVRKAAPAFRVRRAN